MSDKWRIQAMPENDLVPRWTTHDTRQEAEARAFQDATATGKLTVEMVNRAWYRSSSRATRSLPTTRCARSTASTFGRTVARGDVRVPVGRLRVPSLWCIFRRRPEIRETACMWDEDLDIDLEDNWEQQPRLSRDDLLKQLRSLEGGGDVENKHWAADSALLAFIGDDEVTAAFRAVHRWYS